MASRKSANTWKLKIQVTLRSEKNLQGKLKKKIELNDNENTTNQNLWSAPEEFKGLKLVVMLIS